MTKLGVTSTTFTTIQVDTTTMVRFTSLFYDAEDYEILRVVNTYIEQQKTHGQAFESQPLFHSALHPHGIKELAVSQGVRVASAVVDLLGSLNAGLMKDRINALQTLHDEVMYSESTSFRHNTGRVLIEIMKSLIRAHGNQTAQLQLAHDFRTAATGKRRVIRKLLRRYHLLEMPEAWNQIAFDNHVHDANTKGRKSATHLIMDAWIKGIRKLNIVYYNYVEPLAVEELMKAAAIMGIKVYIGVEFQAYFRQRHVQFVWEPRGFTNFYDFLAFLEEKPTKHLMQMGREASLFHHRYVLQLMERYNSTLRHLIGEELNIELSPITEGEITALVGNGQTSRIHLAELIYRQMRALFTKQMPALQEAYASASPEEQQQTDILVHRMNTMTPDVIIELWLSQEKNPEIHLPLYSEESPSVPEIMRLLPATLIDWITSVHSPCNITLNLTNLTVEDVLELLYDCGGLITHLELFNLKNYVAGKMESVPQISMLQHAINDGSTIALKRLIRTIISNYEQHDADDANSDRKAIFSEILHNIPKLQNFYESHPLKTRVGSDSTSRTSRWHGMGFVFPETLSPRAQKELRHMEHSVVVPLRQNLYPCIRRSPKHHQILGEKITGCIRKIPGLRWFGMHKDLEWLQDVKSAQYSKTTNIVLLGGYQHDHTQDFSITPPKQVENDFNDFSYVNTTTRNIIKVLAGFLLTASTFMYTQQWWVLAWFGPLLWFGITGFRNIFQATLGGGGFRRTPLLRWKDYVSWSRLSDSLLYTGISVPILELGVRWFFLERICGISFSDNQILFYSVISIVNGLYIAGHNIFRGFPQEAVIGNLFRSVLAIPVSMVYSYFALQLFTFFSWDILLISQGAAVISKLASDSVAAAIEGYADKVEFLRMREWDYSAKLKLLFQSVSKLELRHPNDDILDLMKNSNVLNQTQDAKSMRLERIVTICALDLMYFWMYLPRARNTLATILPSLTGDEKAILVASQSYLLQIQKISQLFVDGLVGRHFAKPLAFYLEKHEVYLADMEKLTGICITSQPSKGAL